MAKFISEKIKMKTAARLAAVQANYMIAYSQRPVDEVIEDFTSGRIGRFVIEETPSGEDEVVEVADLDKEYFSTLVKGVQSKKEDLEKSLNLFLNEGWSVERLDGTMQALLLSAIYEINNTLDIDTKVIIQEYVDLAYAFFNKSEPKIINALLDQISKEVR